MIIKEKNKWHLYSKDGSRHLGGPYDTKEQALSREKQVNYWKHVKKASFKDEFIKLNVKTDYSVHFWEREFGRPRVKRDLSRVEHLLNNAGGSSENYIEDIPELKPLLQKKDSKFIYQESPAKAKYILAIRKNPATEKHYFVVVTGLNPEMYSNLEDITFLIHLSQKKS